MGLVIVCQLTPDAAGDVQVLLDLLHEESDAPPIGPVTLS